MSGYFKVEREFLDSDFWLSEPFTKAQAWVDLFGLANHAPGFFIKRGIHIQLERSQTGRSELTLAKRWKWSRNKVRRFLKWLENEGMIRIKGDNKTTVITICNYEAYQGYKSLDDTPNDTPNDTPERHQKDTKRNTNKKKENVKNENNNYSDQIKLIIDYLNKRLGTEYKYSTKKTKEVITARINEGFKGDDFKTVIENKIKDWKNTEHEKYLRPSTLFGGKFEEYKNQKITKSIDQATDDGSEKAKREIEKTKELLKR